MPGIERTHLFRRDPNAAIFGLTVPTSGVGISTEAMETLVTREPLRFTIERQRLVERFLAETTTSSSVFLGGLPEPRHLLRVERPMTDLLIERIADRRLRLLRERGLFADSVGMIRELRDVGP